MSYGANARLAIARQANVGSYVTAPGSFHPIPFLSDTSAFGKQELISQNLTGRFEQGATYPGAGNVAGTIEFEITPRALLVAVAGALSHDPAVATSGSVLTRTFLPNTSEFSSTYPKAPYTIVKHIADAQSAELFYDCQFSQLDLIFSASQFSKGRLTVAGGARLTNGIGSMSITPAAGDISVLHPWNVASISIGGSAVQNYSEITVSLNENIGPLYTLNGTLTPFKYTRTGFREVTVGGTLYMNDRSALNDFIADTQRRLLITTVNTRTAIQSGYYDTMIIDVPQMKYTAVPLSISGPGELAVQFSARGVIDTTSNYALQITLQNSFTPTF